MGSAYDPQASVNYGVYNPSLNATAFSNANGALSIASPFVYGSAISTNPPQRYEAFNNGRSTFANTSIPVNPAMGSQASLSTAMASAQVIRQPQNYTSSEVNLPPRKTLGENGNPFTDVDSFTKLIMAGTPANSALTAPGIASISQYQIQTHGVPGDSSNTDASSASKQLIFEPVHVNRIETPGTSCEHTQSEDKDELGLLHTVVRTEHTPKALVLSTPQHSKVTTTGLARKGSVSDPPASLHSSPGTTTKSSDSPSFSKSGEQRRPSDLNKPLPPPPELVNLDEPEEQIIFKEKVFGGSPDDRKNECSPIKTPPAPPLGRRSSSLKSSFDRPISELYKSLRGPKPSDELFNNLSPDLGIETTHKPPPKPPSRKSSNSSIAKPVSSFSNVHIIDQYSLPRDQQAHKADNPFDTSHSHQELSISSFQSTSSISSSSSPSVKDAQLQSSPTSATTFYSPPTPFSASTSSAASPSAAVLSTMRSTETATTKTVTPPATPEAAAAAAAAKPRATPSGKITKAPPPVPPPRRSSSKKDSNVETQSMLNQANKVSTDPLPQIPPFHREYKELHTHQSSLATSAQPTPLNNAKNQSSSIKYESPFVPEILNSAIDSKNTTSSQSDALPLSYRPSPSVAGNNGDTVLADMMALQREVDELRDRCNQGQSV